MNYDSEGSSCGLSIYSLRFFLEKLMKTVSSICAESRTEHLLNTSLERYRKASLPVEIFYIMIIYRATVLNLCHLENSMY
jgi:hypothetical protein